MIKWIIYTIGVIALTLLFSHFWNPALYPFFKIKNYNRINKIFTVTYFSDWFLSICYYIQNLILLWFHAGSKKLSYFSFFNKFFKKIK